METDKTAFEILTDFADNSNRSIELSEKAHPATIIHPVVYHTWEACIPNSKDETSFFVCYCNSKSVNIDSKISGVFFPLTESIPSTITVRKKFVFDKLNPFGKRDAFRVGILDVDSKVIITGSDSFVINKLFKNKTLQDLVIKIFDLDEGLVLGINGVDVDFVPFLKNQSHLGIYKTQDWILEEALIEDLFKIINQISLELNKN
jgi:hypothetical protein